MVKMYSKRIECAPPKHKGCDHNFAMSYCIHLIILPMCPTQSAPSKGDAEVTELPRLADMYILSFLIWHG
jgi:hypothetical protein